MTLDAENCELRKVADRGKPGTASHAVELELRINRRDAVRLIVPFILAAIIAPDAIKPK